MSTLIHLARITIEFTTPLHIGSGKGANGADAGLVLDANGLPTLPGSSIQGVLRGICHELDGDAAADQWFGFGTQKDQDGKKVNNGRQSHLSVSWGLIHDSKNEPVEGLVELQAIQKDEVLHNAANSAIRDHVRLDHRRTAEDKGKFDELALAPGHRFTFEVSLKATTENPESDRWSRLVGMLNDPLFRLGGRTRRGFGGFKVIGLDDLSFNFAEPAEREAWLNRSCSLKTPASKRFKTTPTTTLGQDHSCDLKAEGLWMIGGGADDDADLAPVRATRIVWDSNENGKEQKCFLIPGTSIKGAIAHRTCFHANLQAQVFADQIAPEEFKNVTGPNNAVVKALFGDAVDHDEAKGSPGRIFIDDIYLPVSGFAHHQLPPQNHVSIDPFTGGAKDTALFQDRPLSGGSIPVPIFLRGKWEDFSQCEILPGKTASPRKAFEAALENLKQGSLAIGAHSSRGYGYFKTTQPS